MQSQNIPMISHHWVDTIFRKLRGLAGLELSLTILVAAELIAVPYYRALREATDSLTLRNICTRILEDETAHLRFQASMLARVASDRQPIWKRAIRELRWVFLLGTIFVVWVGHRPIFEAQVLVSGDSWKTLSESFVNGKFSGWLPSRERLRIASRH
jgi:hypothetical protein